MQVYQKTAFQILLKYMMQQYLNLHNFTNDFLLHRSFQPAEPTPSMVSAVLSNCPKRHCAALHRVHRFSLQPDTALLWIVQPHCWHEAGIETEKATSFQCSQFACTTTKSTAAVFTDANIASRETKNCPNDSEAQALWRRGR